MQMAWALLFFLFVTPAASADIYKYVDDNGVICYTDAPDGRKSQQVKSDGGDRKVKSLETSRSVPQRDYSRYVHKAAAKYDLEPELIKAVIKTESNGNHRAVSRKGAMGLMQLMPSTANDMNVMNPFNPEENIDGGSRYLKHLLERFNGNLTLALAAYNSGPKTVEKYGAVPPILETKEYVKKVFSMYGGNKSYVFGDAGNPPLNKPAPIYKIVLDDGTILFTNATLEKSNKTRL